MKDKLPKQGDSLVVSQNGDYFSGVVLGPQDDEGQQKSLYNIVVTTIYPDLNSGKISNKIKAGDKVSVSPSQIRHIHTETVNNIRPHICITVENGMVVFAKRTDGSEEDMIIKVIDEDDGTVKMFTTNAHSFVQMCNTLNENPALI